MFLNCSTCFERHTAHHQEFKNCNCSLWFYIRLCLPTADMAEWELTSHSAMTEAAITVFELLMMSGLSLETCWAIKKHWNNKFHYTVTSCWLFLYDLYDFTSCSLVFKYRRFGSIFWFLLQNWSDSKNRRELTYLGVRNWGKEILCE